MKEMFSLRLSLYWQPELCEILRGGSNSVQYQTADAIGMLRAIETVDKHRHSVCNITNRLLKGLFEAWSLDIYTCSHMVSQMIQLWVKMLLRGPEVRQTSGWQWQDETPGQDKLSLKIKIHLRLNILWKIKFYTTAKLGCAIYPYYVDIVICDWILS